MALITYPDKITGDPFYAEEANEIKTVVNSNHNGINDFIQTTVQEELESGAISDALALKAPIASPTFTGTVGGITKSMVGLGSVDNTSDAGKPVSTAQQTALDLKANLASPTFTGTVGGITKSMVGLGNVDNTADTAKPVSTAQQTALDAKQATLISGTNIKTINGSSVLGSGNITIDTGGTITFKDNIIPTGTINGNNTAFVLPDTPLTGSLHLYADGDRMKPTVDYTLSGVNITMGWPPVSAIICDYRV